MNNNESKIIDTELKSLYRNQEDFFFPHNHSRISSVGRALDCRAARCGFDSRDRANRF